MYKLDVLPRTIYILFESYSAVTRNTPQGSIICRAHYNYEAEVQTCLLTLIYREANSPAIEYIILCTTCTSRCKYILHSRVVFEYDNCSLDLP